VIAGTGFPAHEAAGKRSKFERQPRGTSEIRPGAGSGTLPASGNLEAANTVRVFQPFYTTKPEGMGMGLAICGSIIEAHGGKLWIAANKPRGTAFQFTLRGSPPDQPRS